MLIVQKNYFLIYFLQSLIFSTSHNSESGRDFTIFQISVFFLPINNGSEVLCNVKEGCLAKTAAVSKEKCIILFLWNNRNRVAAG